MLAILLLRKGPGSVARMDHRKNRLPARIVGACLAPYSCGMVMADQPNAVWQQVERHRPYLHLLARKQINPLVWPQIDLSDVVQMTLCQAVAKPEQLRGPDVLAWLRGILWHRLQDAIREAKKRLREKPQLDALDQSSCGIIAAQAAEQSSPSQQACKHEELRRLAEALAQ